MPELLHGGVHRGFLALLPLLILIEFLWHRQRGSDGYDWRETAASTAILIGQIGARLLAAVVISPLLSQVYQHRLFDLPAQRMWSLLTLFLAGEFLYYY